MARISSIIGVSILLFILYIAYTGAITPMDLVLGAIASIIIASFTADLVVERAGKLVNIKRWCYLVAYSILYLTVIEARAHWDVVKRILHPRVPVNPSIVRIPYEVESDYAKTTIANSITNTPGTVVVDVDDKRKVFYVHWIDAKEVEDEKARKEVSLVFEKYSKKIFD